LSSVLGATASETSAEVRARVAAARRLQSERVCAGQTTSATNATLPSTAFESVLHLTTKSKALAERACQHLALSARGFTKILRVARTIADLEQAECIEEHHVAEALQARLLDGPN